MLHSSANKFLFNLVKEKPIYILASLIFSLASAIFDVLGTILLMFVVIIFLGNEQQILSNTKPAIIKYFFTLLESLQDDHKIIAIVIVISLIFILNKISSYLNTLCSIKQAKYLSFQLQSQGINLLGKVDLDYYQQNKVGDILFKLNREVDKTIFAIKSGQYILITAVTILMLSSFLIWVSWQLSLITFFSGCLILYINNLFVKYIKKTKVTSFKKTQQYTQQVIKFLTGIRLIKTVANESQECQSLIKAVEDKNQTQFKTQAIAAIINPVNEVTSIIMLSVLIITSYYLYNQQFQEFTPILLTYFIILLKLFPFISQLTNVYTQFTSNFPSVEIISNFLDTTNKPITKSGNRIFTKLSSGIELQSVTFAYPREAKIVLDKINLWIPQGKTIAIVGSLGAGKSTIASLLSRFYDPIEGQILIDDKNIKEYNLTSFRRAIAVINQETFIFNNSLLYNLTYGLNSITQAEINIAIKKANADEFINNFPQGLETEIGNHGVTLSVGQKQKIAIVRAILRNPELVIIDEEANTFDTVTEKLITAAMTELCRDRTALVITNRLPILKNADQILVLNQGKIMEVGTHQELLEKGDFYHRFYSTQFKSSRQSPQPPLAQKIAKKLAHQTNSNLSAEILNHLDSLLSSLHLINERLFANDQEENKILDVSYQSAKNMLASLKEYQRKIAKGFNNTNL
jgi:ABC-type multidrug transport system fused ATPase/permease subunit